MTLDTASVIASWEAPSWAESHQIDEQAVIHVRKVGVFRLAAFTSEDSEREVLLVQRDEMDEIRDVGSITRSRAYLLVDGASIAVEQARELARLLLDGADILQTAIAPHQARPGSPADQRVAAPQTGALRRFLSSVAVHLLTLGRR